MTERLYKLLREVLTEIRAEGLFPVEREPHISPPGSPKIECRFKTLDLV